MSTDADLAIKAVFGMGFGGYLLFNGVKSWRKKRSIEDVPLSKIRSVAMGPAEVCGEVRMIASVRAPFSNRECVYCSYRVEVPQKNGWRTVDSGILTSVFYVNDGTGDILVNPEGGEFYGDQTYQTTVGTFQSIADPGPAAWIQAKSQGILGSLQAMGQHRFTESIVIHQQQVFVKGEVSRVKNSVQGRVHEENILSRKQPDGTLVLSTYSEERLLQRWAWMVPLQIVGGFALFMGCLSYIVHAYYGFFS